MKIGDQVRFLSEVGGGRVAGFQGKNIVLVEDEDGFQMPMLINEVVVVGDEDYDTKHVIEVKASSVKAALSADNEERELEPADRPVTFKAKPEERTGGDKLSAFLAFVPMEVKELSQTRFESYLVNDSNYYLRYVYMIAEGAAWTVRAEGEIEPNTKEFVEEFGREDLNALPEEATGIGNDSTDHRPAAGLQARQALPAEARRERSGENRPREVL